MCPACLCGGEAAGHNAPAGLARAIRRTKRLWNFAASTHAAQQNNGQPPAWLAPFAERNVMEFRRIARITPA
jgi:hypothetical protein